MVVELLILLFVAWKVYEVLYFRSEKFRALKSRIETYITDCNELNSHIDELKNTYLGIDQLDYGRSSYQDNSTYKYKRKALKNQKYAPNIYNCSRQVCDGARKQPFKYICKYFNIKATEDSLSKFEEVLNNFEAAEDGKKALKNEKDAIIKSIAGEIPFLIRYLSKKQIEKKLGFKEIDFSTMYFPKYIFQYVSSGGNASMKCDIVMDIDNLNRFVNYLAESVKFRKSVAGQRALMTSSLRKKIKVRDNYTCRYCGASVEQEPNLLLEIDHIIPLSKGGLTTEDNLQALCWRCNRKKGARIETTE